MSHSCNPNANRIHLEGPKVVFYAQRPIKKGEKVIKIHENLNFILNKNYYRIWIIFQITISLGTVLTMPKEKRLEKLKKCGVTDCNCKACTENWPTYNQVISRFF